MTLETIIALVVAAATVIGLVSGWIGAVVGNRVTVAILRTQLAIHAAEIKSLRRAKHDRAGDRTIIDYHEKRLTSLEQWKDSHHP